MGKANDVLRMPDVVATLTAAIQSCAATLGTQPDRTLCSQDQSLSQDRFLVRGIPQGGRFSPFLCALHMGGGDANLPPDISRDLEGCQAFFVRLVDDFLYVCAGTEQPCCRFLSSLAAKDNAFGGELNLRKCKANFPLLHFSEPQPRFESRKARRVDTEGAREVPWAGLTLRPEKGLLNIGPSKPQQRTRDTLAVTHRRRRPKKTVWQGIIRSKLLIFLDLKLQPLLVDPRLNSDACVLENVANVCKLCAQRFAWLVLRRSDLLGNVQPAFVSRQLLRLAWRAARRATAARASSLAVVCSRHCFLSSRQTSKTPVESRSNLRVIRMGFMGHDRPVETPHGVWASPFGSLVPFRSRELPRLFF